MVNLRRSMIRRLLACLSISKPREKRGFALIITLSLISFVFLLVITLISQIRLDFSYSDARQQILAKAHARMGMMVAIGDSKAFGTRHADQHHGGYLR